MEAPSDVIDVRAHSEYDDIDCFKDKMYAILDGGADSCILGMMAKVLDYTGGHANLIGYDPKTTKTLGVPIVTAIIKAKSNVPGQIPILLKINQAPINKNSPITLISEYQVREYDLIINSVAKKHWSSNGTYGTQLFQVSADVSIKFEDKGGLMGFELLPIEPGDEEIYEMLLLLARWNGPHINMPQNLMNHAPMTPPMLLLMSLVTLLYWTI